MCGIHADRLYSIQSQLYAIRAHSVLFARKKAVLHMRSTAFEWFILLSHDPGRSCVRLLPKLCNSR